jgi:hypothetical protein
MVGQRGACIRLEVQEGCSSTWQEPRLAAVPTCGTHSVTCSTAARFRRRPSGGSGWSSRTLVVPRYRIGRTHPVTFPIVMPMFPECRPSASEFPGSVPPVAHSRMKEFQRSADCIQRSTNREFSRHVVCTDVHRVIHSGAKLWRTLAPRSTCRARWSDSEGKLQKCKFSTLCITGVENYPQM